MSAVLTSVACDAGEDDPGRGGAPAEAMQGGVHSGPQRVVRVGGLVEHRHGEHAGHPDQHRGRPPEADRPLWVAHSFQLALTAIVR